MKNDYKAHNVQNCARKLFMILYIYAQLMFKSRNCAGSRGLLR